MIKNLWENNRNFFSRKHGTSSSPVNYIFLPVECEATKTKKGFIRRHNKKGTRFEVVFVIDMRAGYILRLLVDLVSCKCQKKIYSRFLSVWNIFIRNYFCFVCLHSGSSKCQNSTFSADIKWLSHILNQWTNFIRHQISI